MLTGRPDIALPLVLAIEAGYLGLLGTHPRFQSYVDAKSAKNERHQSSQLNQETLERIQSALPNRLYDRYLSLRERCLQLGGIASDLQTHRQAGTSTDLVSQQSRGLDRLLWVYLRLLFSSHSLNRFFETVSEEQMNEDLERVQSKLDGLDSENDSSHAQKIRRTLLDSQLTLQERLGNYREAVGNSEFVIAELERVENKIKSLTELSVNRQDPEFMSGQIDQAADSIKSTEKTMNDLRFITGIDQLDDEVPVLMNAQPRLVIE